jgi:pilus assembly protein CpaB
MRLTRQAALAIALICGLLAAVLAWMWIGQQNKPVEKVPETVQIPVPVRTIPAQTDLQPEMFRKVTLERTSVPAGTVLDEQKVAGRVCMTELSLGVPVLETQMALRSKALGLAYGIPRGQRAESIALDVVGAVTDFIQPGNRVDVLVSFNKNGKYVVRTVLQDILVLAAGISTSPAQPAPPPAPAATPGVPGAAPPPKTDPNPPKRPDMPYTLCVTPAQAQLIYVADVSGDLRLTLRGMGDHVILPLPGNNSWTLIGPIPKDEPGGGSSAPAPPPNPAPQPAPQPTLSVGQPVAPPVSRKPTVEIIRGGTRELVTPE